ncbi:TetR/AcrR family transcriptional regulator [Kineosporia sp. R_H_3]|uniref:TetR/AcrR family transcriptional regulator n=1 Tax=Kineosporia sp. R_H_3 TaxID=1961848 RepID=UPI000B4C0B73|nr:TetR/AcrR family transcriptional regulator C-terminal domain-containing protein [Kineosporia sp. R_H_3]
MPARAKEPLSRARVLAAALEVADAEGVPAVTMRRVAEVLDCEAMSLYHYVDKKALLAGLTEAVVGEIAVAALDAPPLPPSPAADPAADPAGWRDVVRRRCLAARGVMLRHPWAPPLVATQPQPPPTVYPLFEALVATMVEAGCGYELAHRAIHSLGSMLLGFTQELFEPTADDEGVASPQAEAMALAMPHLARLAEVAVHEAEGTIGLCDTQAEFEFTLGLVLDGLEAHRRAAAAASAAGSASAV